MTAAANGSSATPSLAGVLVQPRRLGINAPGLLAEHQGRSDHGVALGVLGDHPARRDGRIIEGGLQAADRGETDVAALEPRLPFSLRPCTEGLAKEGPQRLLAGAWRQL